MDKINFVGKRVLLRVDYNVPLITDEGFKKVTDNTRIKATLSTIKAILAQSPASIIIVSHLGRPDGQVNQKYSLEPVAAELQSLLPNQKVIFLPDCIGPVVNKFMAQVETGDQQLIYLAENVRFHWEEEGKLSFGQSSVTLLINEFVEHCQNQLDSSNNNPENDPALIRRKGDIEKLCHLNLLKTDLDESEFNMISTLPIFKSFCAQKIQSFAKELSSLGDIYINDAFGALHRAHASIASITIPVRAAGLLVQRELNFLLPIIHNTQDPLNPSTRPIDLLILGGSKVSDKIKLIHNLLPRTRRLMIGGAMVFTILHSPSSENMRIGGSLYDSTGAQQVSSILSEAKRLSVTIILPSDFLAAPSINENRSDHVQTVSVQNGIPNDLIGLDIGPQSCATFASAILSTAPGKLILWNGPMGVFESDLFSHGTRAVLDAMCKATCQSKVITVIGGGDSAAAAEKWYPQSIGENGTVVEHFSHISTGGGATLELLEGAHLPGLASLGI